MNRLNSDWNVTHPTTPAATPSTRARRRSLMPWLLTLPFCAALANSAQAAIPASERTVLMALYNNAGGADWTDLDGWLGASGTECSWYGITCDQAQTHVTSIDLEANDLAGGPLPALAALTGIQTLDVGGNQLTGTIPSLVGLVNLQYFDVSDNQVTGTIPPLTGLTSLQTFYAFDNQLTGAIPSLVNLTNLSDFQASFNQLTGSIPPLTGLSHLAFFYAYGNQLKGSIPTLTNLTNLTSFDVGSNQLSGSISSLAGVTNLQSFAIDGNQLSGEVSAAPTPNNLLDGQSLLCPNRLNLTINVDWDNATGATPWYTLCDGIFADGFDGDG